MPKGECFFTTIAKVLFQNFQVLSFVSWHSDYNLLFRKADLEIYHKKIIFIQSNLQESFLNLLTMNN